MAGELSFVAQFGEMIARGLSKPNTDALYDFRKISNETAEFSDHNLIVIDKMPQNFLYLGLLATAFPEAK